MEGGVAHPDPRGHRGGDGVLPVVLALGVHDAADVLGAGLLEEPDGRRDVVRGEHAVPVDAYHDRVMRGLDRGVQRGRGATRGIRHRMHPGVLPDELRGDLVRAVRGRAEGDDHLQLTGILLLQDVPHGGAQMPLFIEHRHDHGNGWQLLIGHGSSEVRGSGTSPGGRLGRLGGRRSRYRQRGTRPRPARVAERSRTAWGRRQFIVWAYRVSASSSALPLPSPPSLSFCPIVAEVPQ